MTNTFKEGDLIDESQNHPESIVVLFTSELGTPAHNTYNSDPINPWQLPSNLEVFKNNYLVNNKK